MDWIWIGFVRGANKWILGRKKASFFQVKNSLFLIFVGPEILRRQTSTIQGPNIHWKRSLGGMKYGPGMNPHFGTKNWIHPWTVHRPTWFALDSFVKSANLAARIRAESRSSVSVPEKASESEDPTSSSRRIERTPKKSLTVSK